MTADLSPLASLPTAGSGARLDEIAELLALAMGRRLKRDSALKSRESSTGLSSKTERVFAPEGGE